MQFSVGNMDEAGDGAAQVEQRVQLDRRLGGAEWRPREQRQAEVDGRGVESVDGFGQFDPEALGLVELARLSDQALGELGPDTPIARLVGIGQRLALDGQSKAHVIQIRRLGREADLDIAQALAPGELGESHGSKLFGALEPPNTAIAAIARDDAGERRPGQEIHQLCEQCLAGVHDHLRDCQPRRLARSCCRRSNRHHP